MPNYGIKTQCDIPIVCAIVHNFIVRYRDRDHWLHYYDKDCRSFRDLAFEHAQASPTSGDPRDESLIAYGDEDVDSDEEEPYIPPSYSQHVLPSMNELRDIVAERHVGPISIPSVV